MLTTRLRRRHAPLSCSALTGLGGMGGWCHAHAAATLTASMAARMAQSDAGFGMMRMADVRAAGRMRVRPDAHIKHGRRMARFCPVTVHWQCGGQLCVQVALTLLRDSLAHASHTV